MRILIFIILFTLVGCEPGRYEVAPVNSAEAAIVTLSNCEKLLDVDWKENVIGGNSTDNIWFSTRQWENGDVARITTYRSVSGPAYKIVEHCDR